MSSKMSCDTEPMLSSALRSLSFATPFDWNPLRVLDSVPRCDSSLEIDSLLIAEVHHDLVSDSSHVHIGLCILEMHPSGLECSII